MNWISLTSMPRTPANDVSEQRVRRLVERLFDGFDEQPDTIADVARSAELPHETVRRLYKNPDSRNRSGPGFFIVEAIARARGISLDDLVDERSGNAGLGSHDG